jgi:hypothetical protein
VSSYDLRTERCSWNVDDPGDQRQGSRVGPTKTGFSCRGAPPEASIWARVAKNVAVAGSRTYFSY